MSATTPTPAPSIEERLALVERQLERILGMRSTEKNWRESVGMWQDDALSREIDRLGQEWRQSVID